MLAKTELALRRRSDTEGFSHAEPPFRFSDAAGESPVVTKKLLSWNGRPTKIRSNLAAIRAERRLTRAERDSKPAKVDKRRLGIKIPEPTGSILTNHDRNARKFIF
jgi:hypothetical protein